MSRLKILRRERVPVLERRGHASSRPKTLARLGLLGLLVAAGACTSATVATPPPRPIVIHSGVRIRVDHERTKEINAWVTREEENIRTDPSFMVYGEQTLDRAYPWEDLRISNDTVFVQMPLGANDASLVFNIYAHLHIMVEQGKQEEWLPEAPDATGYELERAILERTADAWVLGRTTFDTAPYDPLDELMYASEYGYLDEFIFTARPEEFARARTEYVREHPGRMDEYREWFLDTFSREPPGLRSE